MSIQLKREPMRKIRLQEEKIAKQLAGIVNDITLDLEEVGVHLANNNSAVSVRRLQIITETAQEEKEKQNGRTDFILN
jgi:hypothetical protein